MAYFPQKMVIIINIQNKNQPEFCTLCFSTKDFWTLMQCLFVAEEQVYSLFKNDPAKLKN
jgi:hypothetical protein